MIPPISAISSHSIPSIGSIAPSSSPAGGSFGQVLGNAIDSLSGVQSQAATQAQHVATGQANLGNAMVASTESLLATQLVVAVRNGAVAAVNQVMSTQF